MSIDRDAAAYGDACAGFYDRIYAPPSTAQLALLRELAGDGSVCELGIGTGRVALPLAAAGVRICGIEASAAMRDALRSRSDEAAIPVSPGDFSRDPLDGPHRLIFTLVSTLSLLPTREAQRACLCNVAAHLEADGVFLYECSVGSSDRVDDVPHQTEHRLLIDGEIRAYPVRTLELPLPLLDEFATAAGLSLQARYRDWRGAPWQPGAPQTISLYRR